VPSTFSTASQQREGGVFVVTVAGELDISTAPQLEQMLATVAASKPRTVLLELTDVGFLDSSGLRVLIAFRKQLESTEPKATLLIDGMSPAVEKVLEVTGLLHDLAHRDGET
jgi:anti-anti-sigma factor